MLTRALIFLTCFFSTIHSYPQSINDCPQNIGFETGTFANWRAYSGFVNVVNNNNVRTTNYDLSETGPQYGQHTIIPKGIDKDEYGGFPLNSPNGSEYIVKLGNNVGGHGAERVSYSFEVPANVAAYSVIFNYAVVLQAPNHQPYEQPKFTVQIIDETNSASTSCGSFEFVAGGALPGFKRSETQNDVVYKPWSPVLLNLTDYIGHRIRLEFTSNDCTFNAHFGYVYLDVTENCSFPVTGNIICPGAEPIVLKSLPGFNEYEWRNTQTGDLLGTADSLVLPADTPVGTNIALKLIPFPGLGCIQTLYTTLQGLTIRVKQPPPECVSVDMTLPTHVSGNYPDLTYTYWEDANATIPHPNPKKITKSGTYYIKGQNKRGCFAIAEFKAIIAEKPTITITDPDPVDYPATVDLTRSFIPDPTMKYSYWRDPKATVPVADAKAVNRDATFYIKVTNAAGCSIVEPVVANIIYEGIVIPNTFTPNGDGINDLLTVLIDNAITVKSFKIFNKWGDVVFTTTDIYNYWDGNKNGTSLPVGVYYWFVDGVDDKNGKVKKSGSVAVLR
ncbi:gliding motility-associated C-terminal domain-containing protein [Daejeonella lutea]|uniref:Gliding motility-associated C-terminal domain-containing protein n=1 Tax=Daejeonella lutea TaxID=572036 RepID=A0A1T5B360_9SPHI|nr:gliding motility-associated C-terminal domain-containing protein [Daejeonella lutea]SKB41721.1 gliding motility-associated C-terminal domain-containing protein [Daejeonella lutea]